ncbi:fibronectin type III domain-containing protein, partial [Flavobacteriaceae bacterium]|nr:fibronectin type III domain-containing protein [Flavobacteriaceae bacterium]
ASEEDISTPIIASCPSCLPPTSLATANISSSSVDITWTSSETSFNIEVVDITSGETADGSIDYTSSTNSYSPTSLSANNDYEVYVQADCGADDTSSWVGPVSFTTLCPAIVPDYTADMSNNPVDNCWKEANNGDAASGPTDLGSGLWYSSNHNGISSNAINLWQNVRSDWIISPSFDLSSSAPSELNVYVALTENSTLGSNADLGSDDSVSLLMTVDGGTTWTSLQTWTQGNVPTDIGEQITYDLSTITGTVQFAFLGDEGDLDDDEDVYFHVSQFRVRETPSCLEVSGLTTANITSSSAVLSWTADASQSLFNVEVVDVTDGESVTGTPTHSSVTNPFTLTGLTANNDYEFYVQADCGGSDTSAWAGPVSFTTLCEAFDVPYTENFDSTSTGTTSNPTVPNCWSFIDGGSGDGYVSSTGANSFYFYNLSDTSGDYILVSPETNALSSGTNRVSFDVDGSMSQDLIVGTLSDPDDSSTFTAIETITLATNNYESYVVNIPAGTDSYIGFKHGQTGTYDSYYLDNIAVIPQPSCLEVSDVVATTLATGFDLSWTAGGIEPAWNIEYGFTGFTQGSGTTIVSSSTSATISGLLSNTSYDIYVQADCGDGDTGAWIGPLTVITNATCGDTLYDSGGSTGSYADDELTIVTVSPTNSGDLVTLTFNSFNTESGYDKM